MPLFVAKTKFFKIPNKIIYIKVLGHISMNRDKHKRYRVSKIITLKWIDYLNTCIAQVDIT
jgi:hypothetical protein